LGFFFCATIYSKPTIFLSASPLIRPPKASPSPSFQIFTTRYVT
jgi:hypothetical protein